MRRPTDGKLVGYNTDCEACITAIEDALRVRGTIFVLQPKNGMLFNNFF